VRALSEMHAKAQRAKPAEVPVQKRAVA